MPASMTVAEIAQRLGGLLEGDGHAVITGLAGIREAQSDQLSFVANPQYAVAAAATQAGAVIVAKDWSRPCSAALIRVENPDKAFATAAHVCAARATAQMGCILRNCGAGCSPTLTWRLAHIAWWRLALGSARTVLCRLLCRSW